MFLEDHLRESKLVQSGTQKKRGGNIITFREFEGGGEKRWEV